MCDTLCVPAPGGMLFAKNSDRPPTEPQVLEWHPRRAPGSDLRTQYLGLPDAGAHALLGSRPTWLWGFEHGVNEHRVAIGNERIWTVDNPRDLPPALIGMDLVRLGLERAHTADTALDVLTTLLEEHGQGGSGEHGRPEPYFSSFLIADPSHAWVVETSARTWAARRAPKGAAISNRIALSTDWECASSDVSPGTDFDRWRNPRTPTGIADHRLAATTATVSHAETNDARALVATLRHHGERPWGAPGAAAEDLSPPPSTVEADGRGVTVCMHVRGHQATTASIVTELRVDDAPLRAWACLGSPCASVYVPLFPPAVPVAMADPAEWHRFSALRDRVEGRADALAEVRSVFAPIEAALWDEADALFAVAEGPSLSSFAARAYAPVDDALRRLGV